MAKTKKEQKPKKDRAKREIWILNQGSNDVEKVLFTVVEADVDSTAAAKKWIRDNGESLAGKTLRIASLSEPLTVTVEKVSRVKLG